MKNPLKIRGISTLWWQNVTKQYSVNQRKMLMWKSAINHILTVQFLKISNFNKNRFEIAIFQCGFHHLFVTLIEFRKAEISIYVDNIQIEIQIVSNSTASIKYGWDFHRNHLNYFRRNFNSKSGCMCVWVFWNVHRFRLTCVRHYSLPAFIL